MIGPLETVGLMGAAFLAGFIDSIAGGGGLIMVPSLLLSGLPPQFALGTNKMVSTIGTSVAVFNFARKKKVMIRLVAIGLGFTFSGAWLGSQLVLLINPAILAKVLIGLLPIGMITVFIRKKSGMMKDTLTTHDQWIKVPLICFLLGVYDGFFGPGAGSFLALSFFMLLHLGLVEATANAKVFNFLSNIAALIVFSIHGKVLVLLGLPLAAAGMSGNYLGSHLALKNGEPIIRKCLIIVMGLLFVTLIYKFVV
jgi:uncharacterized membrane protein YfcA